MGNVATHQPPVCVCHRNEIEYGALDQIAVSSKGVMVWLKVQAIYFNFILAQDGLISFNLN